MPDPILTEAICPECDEPMLDILGQEPTPCVDCILSKRSPAQLVLAARHLVESLRYGHSHNADEDLDNVVRLIDMAHEKMAKP